MSCFYETRLRELKQNQKEDLFIRILNYHVASINPKIDEILITTIVKLIKKWIQSLKLDLGYIYQGNELALLDAREAPTGSIMQIVAEYLNIEIIVYEIVTQSKK